MHWLQERVAKLAKKAEKVGAPIPILSVGEPFTVTVEEWGSLAKVQFVEVTLENAIPKIDGFNFAVALNHHQTPEGDWENIVHRFPEYQERDFGFNLATRAPLCEHCGTTRARAKTYIWEEVATGKFVQVGSSCVKDFGGHFCSLAVKNQDCFYDALEELKSQPVSPSLMTVLLYARYFVNIYGFLKSGEPKSTVQRVRDAFKPGTPSILVGNDEAKAEVADMLEWLEGQDDATDYIGNLKVAVKQELTDDKHLPLIVSLVASYNRAKSREADKEARQAMEARIAESVTETLPVVTGKGVTIKGTVVNQYQKIYDNAQRAVMVVMDDRGFKVWGSVPKALQDWTRRRFVTIGDRVQFVANVEPSDEEHFGFFKNPRQAQYIADTTE